MKLAWRWLSHPWRDLTLTLALVGAAAVPASMSAAADLWERSTADRTVVVLTSDQTADELGVRIRVDAVFDRQHLDSARAAVESRLSEVPGLGAIRTTIFTYSGALESDGTQIGVPVRLVAGPGALDELEVVERGSGGDTWISTWLAERAGLAPGDEFTFAADADPNTPGADVVGGQGSAAKFTVAGTYQPLWNEDNVAPTGFWAGAPPGLLPRFIGPFAEPAFELLVVDERALASSALAGAIEWRAPMAADPTTLDTLDTVGSTYRALETDLARGPIASLLTAGTRGASTRLEFETSLPGTLADARRAAALLVQPIGATRSVGVLLGTIVMATAGWLLVERRRTEFRLLAGDGERWLRLGTRTAWQLATPVAVGTGLGVAVALAAVRYLGQATEPALRDLRLRRMAAIALVGLAAAALVAGVRGQSTIETKTSPVRLPLVAAGSSILSVFMWVQLQRTTASSSVDVTVVAFPLVVLLATGATSIVVARLAMRRAKGIFGFLPPTPAIVWRRVAGPNATGQALIVALALGAGLALLSGHLVTTLDRSISAKLATEIGGATKLDVFGPDPGSLEFAARTTIVRTQDTRITPGQVPVRIVALDPRSAASAVAWPDAFGPPLPDVLGLLAGGNDQAVPAVIVSGGSLPIDGTFGTFQPVPYRVVGSVEAAPLASATTPTLLVSALRMDEVAQARLARAVDGDGAPFQPPSARFRRHVVSAASPSSVIPELEAAGLQVRTVVTRGGRMLDPDILVPRAAFAFMRLFGWVAAGAAAAGLLLYLSSRRSARQLEVLLLRRMGVPAGRESLIPSVEVALLIAIAAIPGMAVVRVLANGLADRFEPTPGLPPKVVAPPLPSGAWLGLGLSMAAVAVAVWFAEWRWARKTSAIGMTDA